ncbi:E3 ubiquitin-protein ligase Os04g0590900 [Camellia lanceoleosa]|uniref:E3 ubiquitin-protein ligase Os04g0590900 n=1 Tax=Camellia lanceoleosa TaxID=1840588 RepID=A0ACC0FZR5_9ERIC|nr:E3 ubiquitin-protein ligase Os04g0590900 [Camellia lanceoleosa]
MNIKDCSQGFCTYHCPQWCYIIFPPSSFSPCYNAIISKYSGTMNSSRRRENHDPNEESEENDNDNPTNHKPWYVVITGLDEALIKSIKVYKYKKGDGLIDCSVSFVSPVCSICLMIEAPPSNESLSDTHVDGTSNGVVEDT